MASQVKNRVCLIVHDGWGVSTVEKGNAIHAANTTNMDTLAKEGDYRLIQAHGLAVGLNDGLMGNSEVGHLNCGAGRIVWQDIVKIDHSIKKRSFHQNDVIRQTCATAKRNKDRNALHLIGLLSDGGVHSHQNHLYALLETAKAEGVRNVYVHAITDGRDTDPHGAANGESSYIKKLVEFISDLNKGEPSDFHCQLATVVGRYYAMDRDKRWERVKIAVDALAPKSSEQSDDPKDWSESPKPEITTEDSLISTIESRYAKDETDEFLKPIIVDDGKSSDEWKNLKSRIREGDTVFFFNYRSDRMREIVSVFGIDGEPTKKDKKETKPWLEDLNIATMSQYNIEFKFPVAFPPQTMTNVLSEWISKQGLKQCHIAETEKYAHITFFFNGGVEKQFPKEDRHMIPSPKVPTYDKQPEMSVQSVADKVAEVVKAKEYEFVMCNFAPPDMVGHTGVYEAAVKAITATDAAVGTVASACVEAGYVLLITADHGNAEQMLNPDTGDPHTAHTTNPVPLIVKTPDGHIKFAKDKDDQEEGALCDVAPTILDIMGLPVPNDMTGHSLLGKN